MGDFSTLLTEHIGMAFDKQLQLADSLEGAGNWELSLPDAELSFADGRRFGIELLGIEALPEAVWLWSWSNATPDVVPSDLLQQALVVRAYGEAHGISELVEPMTNIDERRNGHHFALLGASLSDAIAYYRAPFEGGALFLLLTEPEALPALSVTPIERIAGVFPQMIQSVRLDDHKSAFVHYLGAYGLEVKTTKDAVFGIYEADSTRIHAEFDERQRLSKLTTVMR